MTLQSSSFSVLSRFVASSLGVGAIATSPAFGQIVPDDSLEAERSRVVNGVTVRGVLGDRIDGGAIRGSNLFHSFEQFNIEAAQRVYFSNPSNIENILSRVTGLDPSAINGLLGVAGGANLFLINPNGILFGAGAQLDIQGDFLAGTADILTLGEGNLFSARNPAAPPLVTVNIPVGVQFSQADAGAAIRNDARLSAGQDLTLVGPEVLSTGALVAQRGEARIESTTGDVQVQRLEAQSASLVAKRNLILEASQLQTSQDLILRAEDTVRIRDSAEAPVQVSAGRNLTIQGSQAVDIFALNHPGVPLRSGGDLRLMSDGLVSGDSHFESGGDFAIATLSDQPGQFVSLYDPIIRSTGNVELGDYTGAALKVEAQGSIQAGNITITAPDIATNIPASDPDFALLTERPSLILRAGETVTDPSTGGTEPADAPANLTVGNINTAITPNSTLGNVNAAFVPDLNLTRAGAVILSAPGSITAGSIDASASINSINSSLDPIEGGSVEITAGEDILVEDVNTSAFTNATGVEIINAGNVTLSAGGNLQFSTIDTTAFGEIGEGGNVRVSAEGLVRGSGIIPDLASTIRTGGNIRAGTIAIAHDGGPNNVAFTVGDASVNGVAGTLDAGTVAIANTTFFGPGPETRGSNNEIQITFNNVAPELGAATTLETNTNEPVSFTLAEIGVTLTDADNDNVTLEVAGLEQGSLSRGGEVLSVEDAIALTDTLTYTPPQDLSGDTTAFTIRSSDGLESSQVVAIAVSIEAPPLPPIPTPPTPPTPPEIEPLPELEPLIEEGIGGRDETTSSEASKQKPEEVPFVNVEESSLVARLALPECDAADDDTEGFEDKVLAIEGRGGVPLPPTATFLVAETGSSDWVSFGEEQSDVVGTQLQEQEADATGLETQPNRSLHACRSVVRLAAPEQS